MEMWPLVGCPSPSGQEALIGLSRLKELFKKGGHEVRKGILLRESQGSERREVDMVKIHCMHVRNFPIKNKNILLKSRK